MGFKFEGINWDDVAKGNLISTGRHPARIDKIEPKTSPDTGNHYLQITFTITDGAEQGRKVWGIFMTNVEALWKMRQLCDAIGIDLEGRDDFDADELLGQEVGIVNQHRTYQGEERNHLAGFYSL